MNDMSDFNIREIQRICVFGDSLQDAGNLYRDTGFPKAPYFEGRFTNGPVATEYLRDWLSEAGESKIDYLNFAIGGALTRGYNPKKLLKDALSINHQIDQYEAMHRQFSPSDLISLNGGGNNFLFSIYDEMPYLKLQAAFYVADDLSKSLERMIQMGAQTLIVWNVPNVVHAPAYDALVFPKWLIRCIKSFVAYRLKKENALLKKEVARLTHKYRHIKLHLFDAESLFDRLLVDPSAFGFEDYSAVCVDSFGGVDMKGVIQGSDAMPLQCNPETHVFWDYVHPTTKVHEKIAEFFLDFLKSEFRQ